MAGYLFWRFYVSSKLRPCNRHKVDQMTKRHWYDDSNGMNRRNFFFFTFITTVINSMMKASPTPFMFSSYVPISCLSHILVNIRVFGAVNCAVAGAFVGWAGDSTPFINTVYQQPLGLPTRGHESLPKRTQLPGPREATQEHRLSSPPHACVPRVCSCCKVEGKGGGDLYPCVRLGFTQLDMTTDGLLVSCCTQDEGQAERLFDTGLQKLV